MNVEKEMWDLVYHLSGRGESHQIGFSKTASRISSLMSKNLNTEVLIKELWKISSWCQNGEGSYKIAGGKLASTMRDLNDT